MIIGFVICWWYMRRNRRKREMELLHEIMVIRMQNRTSDDSSPNDGMKPEDAKCTSVSKLSRPGSDSKNRSRRSTKVSNFRKGSLLGKGAYGEVNLSLELSTGRLMAVKSVPLTRVSKAAVASFLKEVELLKNLRHKNVVQYLDARQDDTNLYIFLEYVSGGSLVSLLKQFGPLTTELAGIFTLQILQGLAYLHRQGIMHRDIKGGNILSSKEGLVKISDFGVSQRLLVDETNLPAIFGGGEDGKKIETSLYGTPCFMAPEVVRQKRSGFAADVWSVGCTVIEMLTGKPPYQAYHRSIPAILLKIAEAKGPPPEVDKLEPVAKAFVMECTQIDPMQRPSAEDLQQHLFVSRSRKKGSSLDEPPGVKRLNTISSNANATVLVADANGECIVSNRLQITGSGDFEEHIGDDVDEGVSRESPENNIQNRTSLHILVEATDAPLRRPPPSRKVVKFNNNNNNNNNPIAIRKSSYSNPALPLPRGDTKNRSSGKIESQSVATPLKKHTSRLSPRRPKSYSPNQSPSEGILGDPGQVRRNWDERRSSSTNTKNDTTNTNVVVISESPNQEQQESKLMRTSSRTSNTTSKSNRTGVLKTQTSEASW
mmetsp:Transcript_4358/g.7941  ORF Transcript_4358/g.7941 Transcript_4358/m.7941 type:complete len:599 (+) Transcript_4358:2-1798(+)